MCVCVQRTIAVNGTFAKNRSVAPEVIAVMKCSAEKQTSTLNGGEEEKAANKQSELLKQETKT